MCSKGLLCMKLLILIDFKIFRWLPDVQGFHYTRKRVHRYINRETKIKILKIKLLIVAMVMLYIAKKKLSKLRRLTLIWKKMIISFCRMFLLIFSRVMNDQLFFFRSGLGAETFLFTHILKNFLPGVRPPNPPLVLQFFSLGAARSGRHHFRSDAPKKKVDDIRITKFHQKTKGCRNHEG